MNIHLCSQKNVVFYSPKSDGVCQNPRIYWRYRHDVENTTKHYKTLYLCGFAGLKICVVRIFTNWIIML